MTTSIKPGSHPLPQSVFAFAPEKYKFAAVNASGVACLYTDEPEITEAVQGWTINYKHELFHCGFHDATHWRDSLTVREPAAKETPNRDCSTCAKMDGVGCGNCFGLEKWTPRTSANETPAQAEPVRSCETCGKFTFDDCDPRCQGFDRWTPRAPAAPTLPEQKPPLGIMPRKLWLEQRLIDLAECLARHEPSTVKREWLAEIGELATEWRRCGVEVGK